MTPPMIRGDSARTFVRQLAGMYARFPESMDFKRGVAEMAESLDTYLSALIEDPEQDEELAA